MNNLNYADYSKQELIEMITTLQQSNVLWGKKWVACGDSFTEGDFTDSPDSNLTFTDGLYKGENKVYPFFIGRRNHMIIVNEAKCGSTMTNLNTRPDSFSIERYRQIPKDTDYITLCFGINDDERHQNSPIGTINDTTNTTFYGAWNIVLEYLITNHPYAKIGIIVTNGCAFPHTEAIRRVARKWAIPYLDIAGDYQIPMMHRVEEKAEVCATAIALRMKQFIVCDSNKHPNVKAHEYESTFIENWLRSL